MGRKRLALGLSLGLLGALTLGTEVAQAAPRCFGRQADIVGTPGKDRLVGTRQGDVIVGLGGNDTILGGPGADLLCGNAGKDAIGGHGARDKVSGGAGDDSLFGGSAGDLVKAGGGSLDVLFGQSGNDRLLGGGGEDVLVGQRNNDLMSGGPANDLASFFFSPNPATVDLTVTGPQSTGEGTDRLRGVEGLEGTNRLDTFTGNSNVNFFYLYEGNDVVDGGPGFDFVSFFASENPVTVNLPADTASGEGNDTIADIDDVEGTEFGDQITGDDGPNFLFGLAGPDNIVAGGADDLLHGGRGSDTGNGGADADGDICISIEVETECEQSGLARVTMAGAHAATARPGAAAVWPEGRGSAILNATRRSDLSSLRQPSEI
jgi:Ca2+-binding RTX toxin-like protein